jgi:hypothetical protein
MTLLNGPAPVETFFLMVFDCLCFEPVVGGAVLQNIGPPALAYRCWTARGDAAGFELFFGLCHFLKTCGI